MARVNDGHGQSWLVSLNWLDTGKKTGESTNGSCWRLAWERAQRRRYSHRRPRWRYCQRGNCSFECLPRPSSLCAVKRRSAVRCHRAHRISRLLKRANLMNAFRFSEAASQLTCVLTALLALHLRSKCCLEPNLRVLSSMYPWPPAAPRSPCRPHASGWSGCRCPGHRRPGRRSCRRRPTGRRRSVPSPRRR